MGNIRGNGAEPDQVIHFQRNLREFTDRNGRPHERKRRNDRIHTGTVLQTGIHHRGAFINAPAEGRYNALNRRNHLIIVRERHIRPVQLSLVFHINMVGAVHHDFRNGRHRNQLFQRSQPDRLVKQLPFDQFLGNAFRQRN